MKFGIGQPLKRLEDNKFLTGNGSYNDDIHFKDQVYMHVLRSPHSFAKLKKIDYKEAEKYRVMPLFNGPIIVRYGKVESVIHKDNSP